MYVRSLDRDRQELVSLLTRVSRFWAAWGLRITSYLSFASHILLVVFARSRRHNTCRWQRRALWLAYQTAEISATYALGDLPLSGAGAAAPPSRQQQLVAFWAPLLLLHLGGPDNITAYALEDNALSGRKWFEMGAQVLVVFFALYNCVYLGGGRALLGASIAMASLALAKYAEKACALYQGNLDNMRRRSSSTTTSRDDEEEDDDVSSPHTVLGLGDLIPSLSSSSSGTTTGRETMDDEQALLYAHKLFHACCKRAMVDSSVRMADRAIVTSYKIFSLGWQDIVKVVEMELSHVLYTKADVIHATWWCTGYLLRLVSPAATAAAAAMFWTWSYRRPTRHDDGGLDPADVRFTYVMLAAAFLLDVLWLARALGSSWTHAFLTAHHHQPPLELLQHKLVCSGRWRRLHRFVASLDPCRLFGNDPVSYRRWSGITGRYNLLHEAARHRAPAAGSASDRLPVPATSSRDYLTSLFKCKQDVKRKLFEPIKQRLPLPDDEPYQALPSPGDDAYKMVEITTRWGHKAVQRFLSKTKFQELRKLDPKFGREFQEDIIVWHIGTCVFLYCTDEGLLVRDDTYVKAIEVLSEYLMFLVAARPHMLPGLVLRRQFEETFQALDQKWDEIICEGNGPSSIGASREEKLAKVLYEEFFNMKDEKNRLIRDGIEVGIELLKFHESYMHQLLELIFDVWVDKLLYASTNCSRESHAKQLGSGGELTTIVWIMVEHAGLFRIGETNDQESQEPTYINIGDEEEKKKKQAGEKKKERRRREKEERRYGPSVVASTNSTSTSRSASTPSGFIREGQKTKSTENNICYVVSSVVSATRLFLVESRIHSCACWVACMCLSVTILSMR